MIANYFKFTIRNLLKYKKYTIINILGLAVALTSCIFILHFVFNEIYYDSFHENYNNIYRVNMDEAFLGYGPVTSKMLAPTLKAEFPQVKNSTRILANKKPMYVQQNKNTIKENNLLYADNNIFDVFTFPLKVGDKHHALEKPNSVVITQKIADKYFNNQNPVGKILHVKIESNWYDLNVTGILKDIPSNSDFHVDFMISLSVINGSDDISGKKQEENNSIGSSDWNMMNVYTFIRLQDGVTASSFESSLPAIIHKYWVHVSKKTFILEPLKDIHLYKIDNACIKQATAIKDVYIFSAIAILILIIACFNFIILSTARASIRAKEIGIRKIIGADRKELIKQFLIESIILSFISLPVALIMVELLIPVVSKLLDTNFSSTFFDMLKYVSVLFGIILLVGVFSGCYVAIYLSSFEPVTVLKNKIDGKNSHGYFRKVLITAQIAIFVGLFICSLIIYNQLRFIRNDRLGFNKEHLITIDIGNTKLEGKYEAFKNEILRNPQVVNASAGSYLPLPITQVIFLQTTLWQNPGKKIKYNLGFVDYDYFQTLKAELLKGRLFSQQYSEDLIESVVINKSAMKSFGIKNPIGSVIKLQSGSKRIIGVVDDFVVSHYKTVEPLVFELKPEMFLIGTIVIRLGSNDFQQTISSIKNTWDKYCPETNFEFHFVDNELDQQYQKDQRFGEITGIFTGLAIFIACLGLFGLSVFMIERRTKEVGVRKVLGASIWNIFFLQSKEFIYLSLIANFMACPAAYYFMNKWLQDFAYRIDISWWIFILSGGAALLIALLTVSIQAIKAATANPVEALRYE